MNIDIAPWKWAKSPNSERIVSPTSIIQVPTDVIMLVSGRVAFWGEENNGTFCSGSFRVIHPHCQSLICSNHFLCKRFGKSWKAHGHVPSSYQKNNLLSQSHPKISSLRKNVTWKNILKNLVSPWHNCSVIPDVPCREYLPTFPLVHVAIFHRSCR